MLWDQGRDLPSKTWVNLDFTSDSARILAFSSQRHTVWSQKGQLRLLARRETHWLSCRQNAEGPAAARAGSRAALRGTSLRKLTSLGSNLASVTDLKRIETPHSLRCDFGGYKTEGLDDTTRSMWRRRTRVQKWEHACTAGSGRYDVKDRLAQ